MKGFVRLTLAVWLSVLALCCWKVIDGQKDMDMAALLLVHGQGLKNSVVAMPK